MDGLSAKVFRTYNASITLDQLLGQLMQAKPPMGEEDPLVRKTDYDVANKEVGGAEALLVTGGLPVALRAPICWC